jgi:branched-chain amino acid transport system permease protein
MTFQTVTAPDAGEHEGTVRRRPSRARGTLGVLAVVTVVAATMPFVLPESQQAVAIRVLIFALMATGWNLMSGYGGMFSFGNAAYFGVGAYADVVLLVGFDVSPWIAMLAGAALAAALAVGTGYVAFRYKVRGAYFALATFAIAEMLRLLATDTTWVNGTIGYHVPLLQEESWWKFQFEANAPEYFWIGLALVVVAFLAVFFYLRSKAGRYAVAIRDDEDAAAALGIPVMRYKLTTMALAAAITAVAGAFYAQYYMFVDPDIVLGQAQSIQAIVPAVVGGVGTLWGPIIGAVIVGPLSTVTATLLREPPEALSFLAGRGGLDVVLYAVLVIVIVLALPKGLYGTIRQLVIDRWRSR